MFERLFGGAGNGIPSANPRDAWARLSTESKSTTLIDVREGWEFSRGRAKGAKNIPLSALSKRVGEIPRDRDVYIICQSGNRSMQAARFLRQQGIERVFNVMGGTTVWQMHGLPVER